MTDEQFIKRCYELAINAGKKGFDTFGAVLVHNGNILEEAENTSRDAKKLLEIGLFMWACREATCVVKRRKTVILM